MSRTLSLERSRLRLAPCRCHLGSQRSGSGMGPGLAGSKPWGRRGLRLRLRLAAPCWSVSMGAAPFRRAEAPAEGVDIGVGTACRYRCTFMVLS